MSRNVITITNQPVDLSSLCVIIIIIIVITLWLRPWIFIIINNIITATMAIIIVIE